MFIPIPMSFKNPNTANTVNVIFLMIGFFLIALFQMWIAGGLMIAFSIYNMYAMGESGGRSSSRSVDREHDKDGFV